MDFKIKTASNSADRTMMLDILRGKLYETYHQEFVFVVNHFKTGNGYAWFMGQVARKDGKELRIQYDKNGEWNGLDCCHVETLFKKSGGTVRKRYENGTVRKRVPSYFCLWGF